MQLISLGLNTLLCHLRYLEIRKMAERQASVCKTDIQTDKQKHRHIC